MYLSIKSKQFKNLPRVKQPFPAMSSCLQQKETDAECRMGLLDQQQTTVFNIKTRLHNKIFSVLTSSNALNYSTAAQIYTSDEIIHYILDEISKLSIYQKLKVDGYNDLINQMTSTFLGVIRSLFHNPYIKDKPLPLQLNMLSFTSQNTVETVYIVTQAIYQTMLYFKRESFDYTTAQNKYLEVLNPHLTFEPDCLPKQRC